MNIVFAGTPEFAAIHLQHLIHSEHTVCSVWTQPDKPGKRGKQPLPCAVKKLALENNLPVYQPAKFDEQAIQQLSQARPDIMVVVAFGQILPATALKIPRYGCLNVHASILPYWRGAAPIQRAIQAGDQESGVTIMQMDEGLDTGDILAVERCQLAPMETSASLTTRLSGIGPPVLLKTLESVCKGDLIPVAQDSNLSSYAPKVSKQEAQIVWSLPAEQIARNIRMLNPSPIAYTWLGDLRVKVWLGHASSRHRNVDNTDGEIISLDPSGIEVACGSGVLSITQLQIPLGKGKVLTPLDICNSRRELFAQGSLFCFKQP